MVTREGKDERRYQEREAGRMGKPGREAPPARLRENPVKETSHNGTGPPGQDDGCEPEVVLLLGVSLHDAAIKDACRCGIAGNEPDQLAARQE